MHQIQSDLVAVLVLLLVMTTSEILAQGPPPDTGRRAELIRRHDSNGDGKVSDAEIEAAKPHSNSSVKKGSKQQDGSVPAQTGTELKNDDQMQALFEKFDADGNGKLDLAEMEALRHEWRSRPEAKTLSKDSNTQEQKVGGIRESIRPGSAKDTTRNISVTGGNNEGKPK